MGLCAEAPQPDALLAAAKSQPSLSGLVASLAPLSQAHGPGFHRLSFEGGQLLLTLCIGELSKLLRQQRFQADTLLLDPAPSLDASDARWDLWRVKALALRSPTAQRMTLR